MGGVGRAVSCVPVCVCVCIPEDSAAGLRLRELRSMSPVTFLSVSPVSGLLGAQAGTQEGHIDLLSVVRGAETAWG